LDEGDARGDGSAEDELLFNGAVADGDAANAAECDECEEEEAGATELRIAAAASRG